MVQRWQTCAFSGRGQLTDACNRVSEVLRLIQTVFSRGAE
jgi:hypothetical protein